MARNPFALALASLRRRAEAGAFHPERPIVIQDEARRLSLSATPVREALAWLGGEGLVQRGATGGYFGARLDRSGVRDRLAFRLHCLRLALSAASGLPPDTARATPGGADAVFRRIIERSGDAALAAAFERVHAQLAVLVASEARVLPNLAEEAQDLAERLARGDTAGLLGALAAFHERRIAMAVPLLLDLERRAPDASGSNP